MERCWAGAAGLPFVAERNVGWKAAPFEREVHQLDGGVRLRWVDRINLRTTILPKYKAVLKRNRVQGSYTFESLNSRLESNEEEKKKKVNGIKAFAVNGGRLLTR